LCTLYQFFDPLAQLIAEQFGIAEVNIDYILHYYISNIHVTSTADDSELERMMVASLPTGLPEIT